MNAGFDISWLTMLPVIDTLEIARKLGHTKKNNLNALLEHHDIARDGDAHRALSDVVALKDYYFKVIHGNVDYTAKTFIEHVEYEIEEYLPSVLHDLPQLVSDGGEMKFSYSDKKGAVTERAITPYGWARTAKGLMIHGLCHLRNERRSFYAENITR
ncbi:hypothetical protein [Chrysiogenes arsenatis]|uniref:3'-5' exonuclease n=1 Tax=Chrysiogenes arsenatis TaxID=309797 RepID=UPI001267AC23|nr:hypothetical protein [Chrysiogenes arsenatis]